MAALYDKHYQTENLFGEIYTELLQFFQGFPKKGKVLDLGCGQGRDAIALARLGFEVLGIDNSKVGIKQMLKIANAEKLKLRGKVDDIYAFSDFKNFDFVLLDSMFHFLKRDREKEIGLIQKIVSRVKPGCTIVFCVPDKKKIIETLTETLHAEAKSKTIKDIAFLYKWHDSESGVSSPMKYRLIAIKTNI